MAVGRISGPLLSKNLLRDGVDLAFETDLLYLDVTNGRIGIKTASPEYTLDVIGNARITGVTKAGNLTFSSTGTASRIDNSLGDIVIQAPVEKKLLIKNDTLVEGNLHATGNITAEGSVQIGNMTGSDTLSLFADIISDITPQTANNYNLGSEQQYWADGYINNVIANQITGFPGKEINIGQPPGQDPNVQAITNPVINLNGNVRIWGSDPLGTAPVVQNVLYVSMDGSDTNDGRAADASRACRTIAAALRSPFYKEGTSIKVAPGRYFENNPLLLKPYTSIIGSDLRTTVVEPINKTQDLFHVQSGCYIAQMQMANGQSGLLPGIGYTAGTNRGAYATAFPPNYGGDKIDVFHSPYIQNCTNQSGPWLYDGTMFQPNQVVQIPSAVGTGTWVANTTTMVVYVSEGALEIGQSINVGPTPIDYINARTLLLANKPFLQEQVIAYIDQKDTYFAYDKVKCARDTRLIIDSLIADLVFSGNGFTQSNFAGLQYWNQDGYTGIINTEITTTTAAINYVSTLAQEIVQNITVGTRYTGGTQTTGTAATITEVNAIAADFNIITTILTTGTANVTDIIEPSGIVIVSAEAQYAYDLLQANKSYIQDEAVAFVEATKAPGFVYDQTKCRRDVGFMVDSVSFDILYGGNRQAVQSGVYYYGFSNTQSAIPTERPQTTAAYYRIKDIAAQIITNELITKSAGNLSSQTTNLTPGTTAEAATVRSMIDLITKIIDAGPEAAETPAPIDPTISTDPNVLNAAAVLQANKSFIASEVINYIDQIYNDGFAYNAPKCYRDTGLIVDSLAFDLLYEGDTQSNFAGLQYWNQNGYTGQIPSEVTATINAVTYVRKLATEVVTNSVSTRYQNTVTQTLGTTATAVESTAIANDFDIILGILTTGTVGVTDKLVPNGLASTASNKVNAYNLLLSNKSYIQSEAVAFVNAQYQIFDQAKCARDTGLIVDAIAQDLLFTTSSQSTFAGLQYWNQNGYTGLIESELTTTTNAINYVKDLAKKVVLGDISGVRYSGGSQVTGLPIATTSETDTIENEFTIITDILTDGTANITDFITPNSLQPSGNVNIQYAYDLLLANRTYIQEEAVAYVDANNPGFNYTTSTCYRDVGYMIDSVAFDLLYTGNRQAIQSGVYYYNFNASSSAIAGEQVATNKAYNYIKSILPSIIQGLSLPNPYQTDVLQVIAGSHGTGTEAAIAQSKVDLITNIITNGPSVVSHKTPINLTASSTPNVVNAATMIELNRSFIVAEVLAYISDPTGFTYDQVKCYRDVGYMIESVAFDLLHGGNRQAIHSGVYYYGFDSTSTAIPNEIPQTIAAYNHIRNIVGKIVTGQTVVPTTGNTVTQVTNLTTATTATISLIDSKIDLITNIINNGPAVAETPEPIRLTASADPDLFNAYSLLLANRTFIQAETIAFTDQFTTGFVYNRAKCKRDIGIVVENIAYDIAFGGNEKSRESGLAYWNGVTSYIPNEITETTDAFEYLAALAQDIVTNTTATNLLNTFQTAPQVINTVLTGGGVAGSQITKLVGIINDIIQNGPQVAPVRQVGNGPDWGSVSAEVLLQANRKFIQNEVVDWINATYPGFVYREDLCYRDTGLIIDAITQDIILNANAKTIEAGKTYWTGNKNILVNAIYGDKNQVVETLDAIEHAKQISLQIINNTTVTSAGFVFNPIKCSRDTGLIVDALAQDLLFSGSSQSTFAGIQYWNHGNYVGKIADEITTTTAAINYISEIAQRIVQNDVSGPRYQTTVTQFTSLYPATQAEADIIAADFSTITNILVNGVAGVTNTIVPNSLTPSSDINVERAYDLLQGNIDYLQAEAIAWVEANKDFRYDQVKCARDTALIVDALAFDLAYPTGSFSQSTFAGLQYWNHTGTYTGQILDELTTTTAAINYVSDLAQKIVVNDVSGQRYTTATQYTDLVNPGSVPDAQAIDLDFAVITDILTGGTAHITDDIQPNTLAATTATSTVNSYNLLQANREYIINEAIAYVNSTTSGFQYDPATCARDVGYMLDSVSFDLLHGGNRQAIQSGVYYYTFDGDATAIPNEIPQTIAAYQFINALSEKIVANKPYTPLQTSVSRNTNVTPAFGDVVSVLSDEVNRITDIIQNGPKKVATKEPISLTASGDTDRMNAAEALMANRAFVVAETIAYINSKLTFQYDQATCARDVGYIINSVSFDLLYGGNRQAIQSGVYYWGYNNVSTSLPKEQNASTLAYQYMKEVITNVIAATPLANPYSDEIQVTNLPSGTVKESDAIAANIDKITNIINNGPAVAGEKTPIGLAPSNNKFVTNAVSLLAANRAFIQAEVNAYVEATQVNNEQVFLPFYDKGANATLSVIRNYDLIKNIIENGPGVAPIQSDGNGIFVKNGLTVDDVKIAPVVTNLTELDTNVYQVDISESTIGYGDQQTLYFGQTAVFPLLDPDVPDRWAQRRVNPIGSMGGSLVDGGVVSDRSPINSFVYDAFTQVNQGGVGIRITNNGYAQLVSVFTIFCSQSVITENGGICSITNSNANFGDLCLVSKGYGKRDFSGYLYNPPVAPYYPNGVWPNGGQIEVYIADPRLRPHIGLVMEVEPPPTFINTVGLPGFLTGNTNIATLTTGTINITGIDNSGFVIGQRFHVVDQYGKQVDSNNQPYVKPGTIVADVGYQSVTLNYPLNSGGGEPNNNNYFNLYTCGNAYYTVLSSVIGPDPITPGTLLLPNSQNSQEVTSFDYLNTITNLVISNQAVTPISTATQIFDYTQSGGAGASGFIADRLALIGSILINGPESAPPVTRSGTLPSGAAAAASLLTTNRAFFQEEVIKFVDDTFFAFDYDQAKCARDTGLIVDALAQDLLFSTSSQSTFAALQYWNQDTYVDAIGSEITTTTNAINYVSGIVGEIVQGVVGTRYSTGTQVFNLPLATPAEAQKLADDFTIITTIINTGTAGVTDLIIPNSLTSSTNVNIVRAYNLIQANKAYIQEEAIAYVESTKAPEFEYTTSTCYRDVGYMLDSVSFDLLYGGNRQAVQAGTYYYGYNSTSTAIVGEIPQTTDAYNHIKGLVAKIVTGQTVTPLQTTVLQVTTATGTTGEVAVIDASIDLITSIINDGPGVAGDKTPISLNRSTSTNVINAAKAIEANRAFIVAEVIAYINGKYSTYNRVKCKRDVGLIVDALIYDLANGGNYNAIIAGRSYYAEHGTHHIVQLEENVTNPGLFPDGAITTFYQRSYQSASGYLFEYVGAGTNYGALPQRGVADPIQSKEVVQLNNGKVFFTSTDQNGDFRIGPGLVISQATGVLSGRTFTKSLFANLTPFILAIEGI
jgi:hypothetical protein